MKITITKDFRSFKEGAVYELDPQPGEITYIVGENGCGKSTLMFALRAHLDSARKLNDKRTEGMRSIALEKHFLDVLSGTKVEGFDFDKAFYRDTVVDDPRSLMNAATAFGYISCGGLSAEHRNNGQNRVREMCGMIGDIAEVCGTSSNERILIVMDELDDGIDLRGQMKLAFILQHLIFEKWPNASILMVTHSILTAFGSVKHPEIKTRVFDVKRNKYTTAQKYFQEETDCYIMIGRPKEEEKEQEVNLDELKGETI